MSGDSQPRPNMLRTLWPCGSVNSRNLYVKIIAPFVTIANRPFVIHVVQKREQKTQLEKTKGSHHFKWYFSFVCLVPVHPLLSSVAVLGSILGFWETAHLPLP